MRPMETKRNYSGTLNFLSILVGSFFLSRVVFSVFWTVEISMKVMFIICQVIVEELIPWIGFQGRSSLVGPFCFSMCRGQRKVWITCFENVLMCNCLEQRFWGV